MSAQNVSTGNLSQGVRAQCVHTVSISRLRAYAPWGHTTRQRIGNNKLWDDIWDWLDSDHARGYWLAGIDAESIRTYPADLSMNCPYRPADFAIQFSFTDPDTAFAFKLRFA